MPESGASATTGGDPGTAVRFADGVGQRVGVLRLAIGLAQGIAFYLLSRGEDWAWALAHPTVWTCLCLLALFVPLIPLAALGRMRPATLIAWMAVAALLLVLLGVHDAWRALPEGGSQPHARTPSFQLVIFGGIALYVIHHLIEPADERRRLRPPYPAYVDGAWRHAFQLALALAFTGLLWGVLLLGSALFDSIGVVVIGQALRSGALNCPLLGLAFAGAVHQSDVKPGIIEGARAVGLTLFSWLLLLATGLVVAFLVALIFTGLAPLWGTRRGAELLGFAAVLLIVLLNAAYQDGTGRHALPAVLRWAGRLAGLLVLPLVGLAIWGLRIRAGQYGLTPDRVAGLAVFCTLGIYALGYLCAALTPKPWMKPIETVNLLGAVGVVIVILLVLSPVADPARLSVEDQLARLRDGRVSVDKFDFAALQFHAARYGREALRRLAQSADPVIAADAETAQDMPYYGASGGRTALGTPFAGAHIHPDEAALPADFRAQAWTADEFTWSAAACITSSQPCDLVVMDMDEDGVPEVVAESRSGFAAPVVFKRGSDGLWRKAGTFAGPEGEAVRAGFEAGQVRPVPPMLPDIEVGGQRLRFEPDATYPQGH